MSKRNPAQLALIELPPSSSQKSSKKAAPMPPAQIAKHCNALLLELDRIALEADSRATHLAHLFTAVERAHATEPREQRRAEQQSA